MTIEPLIAAGDVAAAVAQAVPTDAPAPAGTGGDLFGVADSTKLRNALIAVLGLMFIVIAIKMGAGRQNLRKQSETLASVGLIAVVASLGVVALAVGSGFLDWVLV